MHYYYKEKILDYEEEYGFQTFEELKEFLKNKDKETFRDQLLKLLKENNPDE